LTELADRIIEAVKQRDDPRQRQNLIRYFREPIETYGTSSSDHKEIADTFYPEVKGDLPLALELTEQLLRHRNLSVSSVALRILDRFKRKITGEHFPLLDGWIEYLDNWAMIDLFTTHIVAESVRKKPENAGHLVEWAGSENRWRRRASAVTLVPIARKGQMMDTVFRVADRLMTDPDDMVQKGVGWMLKEASKPYPSEIHEYLVKWKPRTSSLVLRYASEKLPHDLKVYKTR